MKTRRGRVMESLLNDICGKWNEIGQEEWIKLVSHNPLRRIQRNWEVENDGIIAREYALEQLLKCNATMTFMNELENLLGWLEDGIDGYINYCDKKLPIKYRAVIFADAHKGLAKQDKLIDAFIQSGGNVDYNNMKISADVRKAVYIAYRMRKGESFIKAERSFSHRRVNWADKSIAKGLRKRSMVYENMRRGDTLDEAKLKAYYGTYHG